MNHQEARAWALYNGEEEGGDGQPRTFRQVGELMELSHARIGQLITSGGNQARQRSTHIGRKPQERPVKDYHQPRESGGNLARFKTIKPHGGAVGLQPDHPAVVEGRTLFPSRVMPVAGSKHFLIGGENNAKIGRKVLKGAWAGMPVLTLTLEERATCPRSCPVYAACYGSGMPFPKRWDHRDPEFMDTLRAEVITRCRENPDGLVIRLHVLGDFYSPTYVMLWADMIERFPQLHIYGYTARREDADDQESRETAAAIRRLADANWDQFAIRFSHSEFGPQRSVVVDAPVLDNPDVIMCPQQADKTATCGTCALCWSPSARDKTIAFARHGMRMAKAPSVKALKPRKIREPKAWAEPAPRRQPASTGPKAPWLPNGEQIKRGPGRPRKTWGNTVGTAAEHLTTTAAERIAGVDQKERDRIAAMYGVSFKPKTEEP